MSRAKLRGYLKVVKGIVVAYELEEHVGQDLRQCPKEDAIELLTKNDWYQTRREGTTLHFAKDTGAKPTAIYKSESF